MDIKRQDLSLLPVLDALLAEGSITGAARRLHLSQPAMSSAVRRLRAWLGDPLLVRVKGGYAFTPRAQALAGPVRRILDEIGQTVAAAPAFDPATETRCFRLATNDAFMLEFLPALMDELGQQAPGIRLQCLPCGPEVPQAALEAGEVDLCAGHFASLPDSLHARPLVEEGLVVVARKGHPTLRRAPSLKQYARTGQVMVLPQGEAFLAHARRAMQAAGLAPHIALQVPHVLVAPMVVARSDLIATLPERVAAHFAGLLGLQVWRTPIEFPRFTVSAVWHERQHRDAGCAWFRETLHSLCQRPWRGSGAVKGKK